MAPMMLNPASPTFQRVRHKVSSNRSRLRINWGKNEKEGEDRKGKVMERELQVDYSIWIASSWLILA